VALPAFAATRCTAVRLLLSIRQQSIDISYSPGPQQQTRSSRVRQANGTDGRTDTVPLHRPCSAYYVDSANKMLFCFFPQYNLQNITSSGNFIHEVSSKGFAHGPTEDFGQPDPLTNLPFPNPGSDAAQCTSNQIM